MVLRFRYCDQVDLPPQAWREGLQSSRFADVRVEGNILIARACDLRRYEVKVSSFPVLRQMEKGYLLMARLDANGTRIIWKNQQVDLDFDTFRYHADADYKLEKDLAALEYYPHYGGAICKLRDGLLLTQEEVADESGFSTRHLSRLENGAQKPTVKLMDSLAAADGLSRDEYIKRLMNICAEMEGDSLKSGRQVKKSRLGKAGK